MTKFSLEAHDPDRLRKLQRICEWAGRLAVDKPWSIEVKPLVKERSVEYCAYLNSVAYRVIGDALGYERDDISEYLCGEYWGWVDRPLPGGRTKTRPLRTTTTDEYGRRSVLSSSEFHKYVEFVRRFGDQHGIYIPLPQERW